MGFYGNVTNTNRTQFVFDRVFANRAEMDGYITAIGETDDEIYWSDIHSDEEAQANVEADSVFIGRYVLVDYDKEVNKALPYRRVYTNGDGKFYFSSSLSSDTILRCFTEKDENGYSTKLIEENYYITDESGNTIVNPKVNEEGNSNFIFSDEIVYTYNNNEYTYYKLKSYTSAYINGIGALYDIATLQSITKDSLEEIKNLFDFYYSNSNIDRTVYSNMGRGWDSTVWQKTYSNGKAKYVMVAELNSVVPSFAISVDPPTIDPMAPHFGTDSTNVFYRLHMQPNWGFRIKKAEDSKFSDYQVEAKGNNWIYDSDSGIYKWMDDYESEYSGAIYYNKDGFNPRLRKVKENPEDEISIMPEKSGQIYANNHDVNGQKAKQDDIQALTINLPSIGDSISKMWDLVYGEGEQTANDENTYLRNTNVDWNSFAGNRLVREATDGSGYVYDPEQIKTLSGCINSVHDLMGMIIVDGAEGLDASNALEDYIYYKDGSYYIKDIGYEYIESDEDNGQEPVGELKEFTDKTYYGLQESNYIKANTYKAGGQYYTLKNIEEKALVERDYEPNKYYYKDGSTYRLETAIEPDDNKYYYLIDSDIKPEVNVDNEKTFFFPTELDYYNAYFNREPIKNTEGMITDGTGLFYLNDKGTYSLFNFEENKNQYIQKMYWWEHYAAKPETDINTNETIYIYDTSTGKKNEITMVQFESNKYFYQKEEDSNYIFLTSENDLINLKDSGIKYYSFPTDTITQITNKQKMFYWPNKYYYQEGNDYIFAKEDVKLKNKYYIITPSELVTDKFYEPNKYYYLNDEGNYVIDTSPAMTEGREYLFIFEKYVKDGNGIYNDGEKWNANITEVPEGVIFGLRKPVYVWKELTGFSRSLNTIHGLIVQINQFLKFGDKLTRDTSTVQGCLNTLNDILNRFELLVPNKVLLVNRYGKIQSAENVTDDWFDIKTDDGKLAVSHKDPVKVDVESVEAKTPNFGDSFELTDHYFDDKGHKHTTTTHTVTIPKGSLTDDAASGSDVITQLNFVGETGALSTIRTNIGDLKLDGYEKLAENDDVASGDTLSQALSKLQTQINDEEDTRNKVIQALDMAKSESNTQFISSIEQIDGKVNVTRTYAGTLQLSENTNLTTSDAVISGSDNLAVAFGKTQGQLDTKATKTELSEAKNELNQDISNLTEAVNDKAEKTIVDSLANEKLDTSTFNEFKTNYEATLDGLVSKEFKFSYNLGEGKEMNIQELFDYIVELENRIYVLENPSSGEEENSIE